MATITRRTFVKRSSVVGGGLAGMGGLQLFGAQARAAVSPGYGPLAPTTAQNDPTMVLNLPAGFHFEVISRQGLRMSDGNPTPGIFDGTGAYPTERPDTTILIRNHENRRRLGEIPVIVPGGMRYDSDSTYDAGNTKLVVRRRWAGRNADRTQRYAYDVMRDFAILGGTDTNCAGGVVSDRYWYTCEETVNRSSVSGLKHGYNYGIDAYADGPVKAIPLPNQGRFVHEAVAELGGILYQTEDRSLSSDAAVGRIGSVFYRFVPDGRRRGGLEGPGKLQGLKLTQESRANMDSGRAVGQPHSIGWVDVDTPDHNDDTDNRRDRVPGFTPTRIQAIDKGAAFFDRQEGIWTATSNGESDESEARSGKVYFDCTTGGPMNLGQVWCYDPKRETLTLIYESADASKLEGPDNVVIVPRTGDVLLQEDASGVQFLRGVTPGGEIYDFAETVTNDTEFCGGCFDVRGETLFVSQQGERTGANAPGTLPLPGDLETTPDRRAVTYAIYGPFEKRGNRE